MTDEEFIRIKTYLKMKYGIDMKGKKAIVEGRLDNYLRINGWTSYSQFMNDVESDKTGKLEKQLVNSLSTNHTYFMREAEHFEFLRREILPYLRRKESRIKDLRVWCAASSSGEEAYTLAMIMLDFFGLEHNNWNTQILATDVSTDALRIAVNGVYTSEQIEPIPDNWKRRFFRRVDETDDYIVSDELKNEVLFRKFNLMEDFPFRRKMHVIFLRNVMIYFDEPTKNKLLHKIYDCLEPGGYLFLGRTETLNRQDIPFNLVMPSVFRK